MKKRYLIIMSISAMLFIAIIWMLFVHETIRSKGGGGGVFDPKTETFFNPGEKN
ncbi:hypothetical protein [Leisingera caerulea]|uniref:hypothetical protein n=1 Tax=Leisingera caerulea TaxID=506591 RepID=UPI0021A3BDC9|nr:hypothetical protein [Leisingera caerulea]UWQ83113.1 hypothetical protein K3726_15825 [Leisingera caerulea]